MKQWVRNNKCSGEVSSGAMKKCGINAEKRLGRNDGDLHIL